MCRLDTARLRKAAALCILAASTSALYAQVIVTPDWRRIGNTAIEANLVSPAGGPVSRVWYSPDGQKLFVRSTSGRTFETMDFEKWSAASETVPVAEPVVQTQLLPERGAKVRLSRAPGSTTWYALGKSVYSSNDEGRSWRDLTRHKNVSLIGEGLADMAVSPTNSEEIAVAGRFGIWRSLDSGLTWSGLNDTLANLPVRRLAQLPSTGSAVSIILEMAGVQVDAEWRGGQASGWKLKDEPSYSLRDAQLKASTSNMLESDITAVVRMGSAIYAGASDGRVWGSTDEGSSWSLPFSAADTGSVVSLTALAEEPRIAFATLASSAESSTTRLIRTINGGLTWDNLTSNLPEGTVRGVTADLTSGAIYAATSSGLFVTYTDLRAYGPPPQWSPVDGLPKGAVADVQLDAAANQVYVAMEADGVFAALAPHRFRIPKLLNGADYSSRPAAPGSLLSYVGGNVSDARVGNIKAPILSASNSDTQFQVPFEVSGTSLNLAVLTSSGTSSRLTYQLAESSPAVFIHSDGAPMIIDAERGLILDAGSPARGGNRIQVLATGLGRVTPKWQTGVPAPRKDPPKVEAPVKAYLDQSPVKVLKATLAPDLVGLYIVEIQLPDVVNSGPAQLVLESGGLRSDSITIHLRAF